MINKDENDLHEFSVKYFLKVNFNINKPIKEWYGDFDYVNAFTSLYGCPEIIRGNFLINDVKLDSLKYCPKEVDGDFNIIYNSQSNHRFTKEEISAVCKVGGHISIR
jgi:hypothetical protein